jgi:hypothetical protein
MLTPARRRSADARTRSQRAKRGEHAGEHAVDAACDGGGAGREARLCVAIVAHKREHIATNEVVRSREVDG